MDGRCLYVRNYEVTNYTGCDLSDDLLPEDYLGKRELYGEALYKIYGSRMRTAVHLVSFVLVLVLWSYCVWKIFEGNMETIFIDYIYLALLLVEAIVAGVMDVRPQKVYENGILGYKGFIPWSDMRGILDSKRKS